MSQPSLPRHQPPQVSDHYLTQAGLAVALTRLVAGLWPELDPARMKDTLPPFRLQVYALIHRFALASATLAARDYMARRATAGVRSPFRVLVASPPSAAEVAKNLDWATSRLWYEPDPVTVDAARTRAEGSATRMVLNTGRQTTVDAVTADRHARAWAREVRPDCCSFCALMASRGAIYHSEGTAGRNADSRFTGTGSFKWHNNCHCVAAPVFGVFEMSATAREAEAVYRDREQTGNALNDFRKAWESRSSVAQ